MNIELVCWHCRASKTAEAPHPPQFAFELVGWAKEAGMVGYFDLGRTLIFCNAAHARAEMTKAGTFRLRPKGPSAVSSTPEACSMSKLKAYQVRESGEGHCIIRFATNSAAARREGAAELDTCWESIESCNRTPEFDQYAPGPVPPLVLIEHGWWFECTYCGQRVSEDGCDSEEDEPLGPPVAIGRNVFCCEEHAARQMAQWRGNAAAKAALCEVIYTRWPAAEIVRAHVYGDRLEPPERTNGLLVGGIPCLADFKLPGLTHAVTYHFGEPVVYVSTVDEEKFRALYSPPRQLVEF